MLPQLYYAQHSHYQEDIPFWLELAGEIGDPVLELGCGTGRVLIPLAQAGHRCTGIDLDLSMLKFLQMHLEEHLKLPPLLIAADMRQFNLAREYSLVIMPCNTFSTLDQNGRRECLQCIHRVLLPEGKFVVCIPNPEALKHSPVRSEAELEDEFLHPQTGNPVQVSSAWQRRKNTFIITWYYDTLMPDGTVERRVVKNIHYIASIKIFIDEFQSVDFSVDAIYGDFARSKYAPDSSHLILSASCR